METASIYHRHLDQQRILITGDHRNLIARLVVHVLKHFGRKFDYISDNQHESHTSLKASPLLLMSAGSNHSEALLELHHHALVLSDITPAHETLFRKLADATPKAGLLFYSETEPARSIGKIERPDVNAVPFGVHPHELSSGRFVLLTEEKEKIPVRFTTESELRSVQAAKEVLRKIGIQTNQFYAALTGFPA